MTQERGRAGARTVTWGGLLAGIGLGGFFDGIVLHQILQWHHMVSAVHAPTTLAGLEVNTLADGLFHAGSYLATLVGLVLLWRGAATRGRAGWPLQLLLGLLLAGWGAFNLVEGLVDHQILGVHHVRPGPNQVAWDVVFLASGALLLGLGVALVRTARPVLARHPADDAR